MLDMVTVACTCTTCLIRYIFHLDHHHTIHIIALRVGDAAWTAASKAGIIWGGFGCPLLQVISTNTRKLRTTSTTK